MKSEYDTVKQILIKHDVLHKDIDQLDDPILMQDLYMHFQDLQKSVYQCLRTWILRWIKYLTKRL